MKNQKPVVGPGSSVELPHPEKHYREQGIGSRTTFYRWEQMGLPVMKVGRRRFIKQSALASFLDEIGSPSAVAKAPPTTAVEKGLK